MNDNFFYDIDEILRALDHYQGDPFFLSNMPPCFKNRSQKGWICF